MRLFCLFCLFCLSGLIFIGCAGGGIGGTRIGKRQGCIGTINNKVHFVILTDTPHGCSLMLDVGTAGGPHLSGSLNPTQAGHAATRFSADPQAITINGQVFQLTSGRVFLVSTGSQAPGIRQINISLPRKGYAAKALENPDIRAFCLN